MGGAFCFNIKDAIVEPEEKEVKVQVHILCFWSTESAVYTAESTLF